MMELLAGGPQVGRSSKRQGMVRQQQLLHMPSNISEESISLLSAQKIRALINIPEATQVCMFACKLLEPDSVPDF